MGQGQHGGHGVCGRHRRGDGGSRLELLGAPGAQAAAPVPRGCPAYAGQPSFMLFLSRLASKVSAGLEASPGKCHCNMGLVGGHIWTQNGFDIGEGHAVPASQPQAPTLRPHITSHHCNQHTGHRQDAALVALPVCYPDTSRQHSHTTWDTVIKALHPLNMPLTTVDHILSQSKTSSPS